MRVRRRAGVGGAIALALACGSCVSERATGARVDRAGCDVALPSEAFGTTIVVIRDFAFTPARVTVRPGERVTWVNCGAAGSDAHTSTGDAGGWSSPLLAPGETFTREFAAPGMLPYHCEPHPGMTGTVVVE